MTDSTTPAASPLPADVAGLVERATAAMDGVTPGPWVAAPASHGPVDIFSGDRDIVTLYGVNHKNNARFIAAARQLVPDLMAAIKAQAQQIADLSARAEKLGRDLNVARYGQPDFAWSVHKQAMADLEAENARLGADGVKIHSQDVLNAAWRDDLGEEGLAMYDRILDALAAARKLKGGDNG